MRTGGRRAEYYQISSPDRRREEHRPLVTRESTLPYRAPESQGGPLGPSASGASRRGRSPSTTAPVTLAPTMPKGPRQGSSHGSASAGLLRALQEENDTLRSQLLRTERERDRLTRQLEAATTQLTASQALVRHKEEEAAAAAARNEAQRKQESAAQLAALANDPNTAMTRRLQERCEALADRLLGMVRDQQVSQSSEVYFLLRTQQEERSFLCDALEDLLEETGVETAEERAARQQNMYGRVSQHDGVPATSPGSPHAGTVTQLAMLVADALRTRAAWDKLEKARARMALEQAAATLQELQRAVERITRTVFTTTTSLVDTLDATAIEDMVAEGTDGESGGGGDGDSSVVDGYGRGQGGAWGRLSHSRGGSYAANRTTQTSRLAPAGPSHHLSLVTSRLSDAADGAVGDLDWSCDALKACFKGLAQTQTYVEAASEVLTTRPPNASTRWARASTVGEVAPTDAAATPEMARLLESVLTDLRVMARRGIKDREVITHRLTAELQHHYDTAKQYEQRIRMLEAENTRLVAAAAKALVSEVAERSREKEHKEESASRVRSLSNRPWGRREDAHVAPSATVPPHPGIREEGRSSPYRERWGRSQSTINGGSASPPERFGVYPARGGALFPAAPAPQTSPNRWRHGTSGAGHHHGNARGRLALDDAAAAGQRGISPPRSRSTSSDVEEVEASPLDVRAGGSAGRSLVSSDRRGPRSASLLSPLPARHDPYAEWEARRAQRAKATAALVPPPAGANERKAIPRVHASPRGGEEEARSVVSERSFAGQMATSPYHGADDSFDAPSPPPKPVQESRLRGHPSGAPLLAEVALAEHRRQQQQQQQQKPAYSPNRIPSQPLRSPREGTAPPERHISSPSKQGQTRGGGSTGKVRPAGASRRLRHDRPQSSGSSSGDSGSGSHAELITSDVSEHDPGQRTPEVWRRIREEATLAARNSPSSVLGSPTSGT